MHVNILVVFLDVDMLHLSIRVYCPSHWVGPPDYILCLYRAVVDRFLLDVQYLLVHMKEYPEKVAYELTLTSPAVSCVSCSSDLNGFRDGRM